MGTGSNEQGGASVTDGPGTAAEKKAAEAAARDAAKADADAQAAAEPTFTRERLLGPDGETIAGYPHHLIVGALERDDPSLAFNAADRKNFTRAEITEAVEAFLGRSVARQED